jgi:hypothetical protein
MAAVAVHSYFFSATVCSLLSQSPPANPAPAPGKLPSFGYPSTYTLSLSICCPFDQVSEELFFKVMNGEPIIDEDDNNGNVRGFFQPERARRGGVNAVCSFCVFLHFISS